MSPVRRLASTLARRLRARRRGRAPGDLPVPGAGAAAGGGLYVQYYVGHSGAPSTLTLTNIAILVLVIGAAALAVEGLGRVVPPARRAVRARRARLRRRRAATDVERRARALMSELCPHGWRAQITLLGPGDDLPPDAPGGERARVALDWAELEDGHPAVVRRVWAPTIAEALEAMVADRRTDETLEQIERGAVGDGATWPDL